MEMYIFQICDWSITVETIYIISMALVEKIKRHESYNAYTHNIDCIEYDMHSWLFYMAWMQYWNIW